jgi:hypothetical protein
MSPTNPYPVSLLLDGPLFKDELVRQPQEFKHQHDIEALRLIPSKSAAEGVHTIYFHPEHRQWALVRLATRYRGLFEIQLQRGLSGEHQLLRQEFQSADIDFLSSIIPRPPESYSPIVYDMLWLAATYEEYLILARRLMNEDEFVPRELLESTDELSVNDSGFFTRFLRSHFIVETESKASPARSRSSTSKSGLDIDLDASYSVTPDGREALQGIVVEHERIFETQEFEPLLINDELDPYEHMRAFVSRSDSGSDTLSIPELEEEAELLGEIAASFAPLDDSVEPENEESDQSTQNSGGQDTSEDSPVEPEHGTHAVSGPLPTENAETAASPKTDGSGSVDADTSDRTTGNSPGAESEPMVGSFTESEIRDATVAAAQEIKSESLLRTVEVKETVWETIDLNERSQSDLWNHVETLLLEMEDVHGREGGHVWVADEFNL